MDYIDLLLIHELTGDVHEIYRAMKTAYSKGKLRAINQVETHVFRQQKELRRLECQIGTKHESWSQLACGKNGILQNPTLIKTA